jgi:hypothetical protein
MQDLPVYDDFPFPVCVSRGLRCELAPGHAVHAVPVDPAEHQAISHLPWRLYLDLNQSHSAPSFASS